MLTSGENGFYYNGHKIKINLKGRFRISSKGKLLQIVFSDTRKKFINQSLIINQCEICQEYRASRNRYKTCSNCRDKSRIKKKV